MMIFGEYACKNKFVTALSRLKGGQTRSQRQRKIAVSGTNRLRIQITLNELV